MSYFEDYIEDGLCCEGCGEFLDGDEPGFVRRCGPCSRSQLAAERTPPASRKKRRKRR